MFDKKWLVLLFLLTCVCAQETPSEYQTLFWPWEENLIGLLFWVVFWISLIVVVYLMLKNINLFGTKESPLEILNKRYARGEISRKKFKKMKKEISK